MHYNSKTKIYLIKISSNLNQYLAIYIPAIANAMHLPVELKIEN